MPVTAPEEEQPPISASALTWRAGWIVVRLLASYCLAKQVSPFFYQQF